VDAIGVNLLDVLVEHMNILDCHKLHLIDQHIPLLTNRPADVQMELQQRIQAQAYAALAPLQLTPADAACTPVSHCLAWQQPLCCPRDLLLPTAAAAALLHSRRACCWQRSSIGCGGDRPLHTIGSLVFEDCPVEHIVPVPAC